MHRPQPEQPDPSALPAPPEALGGPTVGRAQGVKPCPRSQRCRYIDRLTHLISPGSAQIDGVRAAGEAAQWVPPSSSSSPQNSISREAPGAPAAAAEGGPSSPPLAPGCLCKVASAPGEEQSKKQPGAGTCTPNTQLPKIQEGWDRAAPPNHPGHPTNGDGWELPAGARRGAGP